MSRIAIVGSCVTRDLWPITGDAVDGLLYISRTSLPSLFAKPVSGFEPSDSPPEPLRRHQHLAVVADLSKRALAALVAHRPTHVIFDFIDERFDLLHVAGTLATYSWELEVSGYLDQPALAGARTIPRLSEACERLWLDAAAEMAAFLQATPLREAKVLLHEAQWAGSWTDETGTLRHFDEAAAIWDGRSTALSRQNALLDRYQEAFCALVPEVTRLVAGERSADPSHRWGLSPFHYTPDYYEEIWSQAKAAGI